MSCDFESAVPSSSSCWLAQDDQDDFDWTINSGKTPSGQNFNREIPGVGRYPVTGPEQAEEGSKYIYIEASGREASRARYLIDQ